MSDDYSGVIILVSGLLYWTGVNILLAFNHYILFSMFALIPVSYAIYRYFKTGMIEYLILFSLYGVPLAILYLYDREKTMKIIREFPADNLTEKKGDNQGEGVDA